MTGIRKGIQKFVRDVDCGSTHKYHHRNCSVKVPGLKVSSCSFVGYSPDGVVTCNFSGTVSCCCLAVTCTQWLYLLLTILMVWRTGGRTISLVVAREKALPLATISITGRCESCNMRPEDSRWRLDCSVEKCHKDFCSVQSMLSWVGLPPTHWYSTTSDSYVCHQCTLYEWDNVSQCLWCHCRQCLLSTQILNYIRQSALSPACMVWQGYDGAGCNVKSS